METFILFVFIIVFIYLNIHNYEYFDNGTAKTLDESNKIICECIKPGFIQILNDEYQLINHIACLDVLK